MKAEGGRMKEKKEGKSFELFFLPSSLILHPCFSAVLTRNLRSI